MPNGPGAGECIVVVRVPAAIAEPIEPQLARVLAAHHRRPCRNGDRWMTAAQLAPQAALHQSTQIGQPVAPDVDYEALRNAVQSNHRAPSHELSEDRVDSRAARVGSVCKSALIPRPSTLHCSELTPGTRGRTAGGASGHRMPARAPRLRTGRWTPA